MSRFYNVDSDSDASDSDSNGDSDDESDGKDEENLPIPHGFFATITSPGLISGIGAIRPFSSSRPGPIDITFFNR